jgi:CoA-transferase family III/Enoyl-CoA hydratase/isomerase/AMP-binding enzyme
VESAKFGLPEVRLGLIPGGGGTQRLPRLIGKGRALQLILSGEMIEAREAYRIGLVNEIVPAADLITRAEVILKKIASNAPISAKFALEAVNKGTETSQSEGLLLEASYFGLCAATEDKKEGTSAFLEKRAPVPRTVKQTRCTREFRRDPMASDNIFSGLKVVDFASFLAGPSAAVILSDFGADVVKVEPPAGDFWRLVHKVPPQPQAKDAYPWHLANRNKRGITLDLKSPSAQQVVERLVKWADVLIVNTPHRMSPEQIAYTIDHAGSSTLLVNDEFVDLVHSILPQLSKVKRLVVLTDRKAPATGKLEFIGEYEELLGAASPDFEFADFDENVQATTFYTTGTTGLPKGVYYSHRQLVLHAIAELAMFGLAAKQGRFHREDVYMPITPMFHVHAWGFPWAATLAGAKQVYPGRYDPALLIKLIKTEGVTSPMACRRSCRSCLTQPRRPTSISPA